MKTEMICVLISKGSKGRLLRMKSDELARLRRDFAGFKESNAPGGGAYTHYLYIPTPEAISVGWFRGRHASGGTLRRATIDLNFPEITGITGA